MSWFNLFGLAAMVIIMIPNIVFAAKRKYGFEQIKLHKVQISVKSVNLPSKRVIEKCGFTYEGTLRDYFFEHGEYVDRLYYSILQSEYERPVKAK
ncbi:MAG: GNAT family protein [Acutalibacteraceae bacterium]|nr:GNAT family protein [Acutalibacteraceae bacterium]